MRSGKFIHILIVLAGLLGAAVAGLGQASLPPGGLVTQGQPPVTGTGNVLQNNGPNQTQQPLGLGGGVAGSLNVIPTPSILAPTLSNNNAGTGVSTRSYVCQGTDSDGHLINGATATMTNLAATWTAPANVSVACPWSAGVVSFQIYRTVGGPSQGLLASIVGEGATIQDINQTATAGTPTAINGSSPHISVSGQGTTGCIAIAGSQLCSGAGTPPTGCGSIYQNAALYLNSLGTAAGTNLLFLCDGATSTWVDIR